MWRGVEGCKCYAATIHAHFSVAPSRVILSLIQCLRFLFSLRCQTKPASFRPSSIYQDRKALRSPFDHVTVCWVGVQQTLWQQ